MLALITTLDLEDLDIRRGEPLPPEPLARRAGAGAVGILSHLLVGRALCRTPHIAGVRLKSGRIGSLDVLNFRCSAPTFSGHRIHCDRQQFSEVKGYRCVVVHGPRLDPLIAWPAVHQQPDMHVSRAAFKASPPIVDNANFRVCGRQHDRTVQRRAGTRSHRLPIFSTSDAKPDICDALYQLCARCPVEHHREIGAQRAPP